MDIIKEKLQVFNFISKNLQKIASNNNIVWNDSFIKWESKSNEYDFSTSLPMAIFFSSGKSKDETFFDITKSVESLADYLDFSRSQNGYLNFTLKENFYKDFLNNFLKDPFPLCCKRKEKVNVEFVSVNPTGYLHLGHLRNALIGDAIANIYKFVGFEVSKEYYVNDRGKQIDNLVKSIFFHLKNFFDMPIAFSLSEIDKEDLYQGKSIEEVSRYLVEKKIFKAEEMRTDNVEIRNEIINFFLSRIALDLESFGIFFDKWFSEKEMYSNKSFIDKKMNLIFKKSNYYKKNGAFFLRTTVFGDEKDRVIIKENGDFTYFLSDIIYHVSKLERFDNLVNVWGSDHHGYVERVKSSLRMLGFENIDKRVKIVLIQMVNLLTKDGPKKFSKRLGNTVTIEEALLQIKKDQLRFSLLETDANTHLSINTAKLIEEDKNSKLYYIQYAYARCNQILNSSRDNYYNLTEEIQTEEPFLLKSKKEKKLIKEISKFEGIVLKSAEQRSPQEILKHSYLISSEFHSYYQSVQILVKSDLVATKQRLLVVKAIKIVLENSLKIFSIEPKPFMTRC